MTTSNTATASTVTMRWLGSFGLPLSRTFDREHSARKWAYEHGLGSRTFRVIYRYRCQAKDRNPYGPYEVVIEYHTARSWNIR